MSDWPTIGSTWVDSTGRTLVVREIQPKSRLDRHVVGTCDGRDYACSGPTFDAVWRAGAVGESVTRAEVQAATSEAGLVGAKLTPLFSPDGKPLPYTRRS